MDQEGMKRMVKKSDRQLLINDLNTGFGLSIVEAEALYDSPILIQTFFQSRINFTGIYHIVVNKANGKLCLDLRSLAKTHQTSLSWN